MFNSTLRYFIGITFCVGVLSSTLAGATESNSRSLEISGAAQPQLTVDSGGRIWVTYAKAGDIFVARSIDEGATFSEPTKVAHIPKLMVGMRRGPRIAARGDSVTVTAIAHELIAFNSNDGGKTWSAPVTINDVATCAREGLHDLAAGPDGRLFVTWLDLRSGAMELWGAQSDDGGINWRDDEQVYRSPDKSICTCCQPSAVYDSAGNLAVMWRNSLAGSRDMWLTTRRAGAKNFSDPHKLGSGSWKIDGCPMDGGQIVAMGDGKFSSVWQRNGEVFFCPDQGNETSLGQGKQPVAINRDNQLLIVCQQGTDLVSLQGTTTAKPATWSSGARFPCLVATRGGTGAILAYERVAADGELSVVIERF